MLNVNVFPPPVAVIIYPVIAEPPLSIGEVQLTVNLAWVDEYSASAYTKAVAVGAGG